MSIVLMGSTSGSVTLQEPAVAGSTVLDLPATSGTVGLTTSQIGMKNRIINGAMVIDQRNAGAAVTTAGSFPVDRFLMQFTTDGAFSASRSTTAPAGFTNSLIFTTTTADTSLGATQQAVIQQNIEGFNVADLGWGTADAKTVTISFWVRSSLTGTFGGSLKNSAANRSYPFTYTISSANTFEYKTVTIAGDTSGTWLTDNGIGITLSFGLGVGSDRSGTAGAWNSNNNNSATGAVSVIGTLNATFYITGVQLELGSVATTFDFRAYGTELALCQRYYQWVPFSLGFSAAGAGTFLQVDVPFQVQMRAVPSFAALTADPNTVGQAAVNNSSNSFSASYATLNAGLASLTATAAGTCQVLGYRSAASAEL